MANPAWVYPTPTAQMPRPLDGCAGRDRSNQLGMISSGAGRSIGVAIGVCVQDGCSNAAPLRLLRVYAAVGDRPISHSTVSPKSIQALPD